MAHPFFDRTVKNYPWHRPEARELHKALYAAFTHQLDILRTYNACADDLPPLAFDHPPDAIWTYALNKLTLYTGALQKLCELNKNDKNARLRDAIRKVIDAKAEHLSKEQIDALKNAFTTTQKSYDAEARRKLLGKLPQAYIDQLPKKENDTAQLSSDVDQLNTTEQFEQQVPLKTWLENAYDYFGGTNAALVFKQTLEDLTTHHSQRTDTHKITDAIEKVWEKIQANEAARDAVRDYKKVFHQALQEIDAITDFKGLHEEIHTLQMGWPDNIDEEIKGLPADPKAKLNVRKHSRLLTNTVQQMRKIMENGNVKPKDLEDWCQDFDSETENGQEEKGQLGKRNWLEALGRFETVFSEAVNTNEKKKIGETFGNVSSCLSPTLSGLNKQLKKAVDALHLKELIEAMRQVCCVLIKLDHQRIAEKVSLYKSGISELEALGERLHDLKDQHDRWQVADINLKMFKDLLHTNIIGGIDTGPVLGVFLMGLTNQFEPLYRESAADWARELKTAGAEIRSALEKKDNNSAEQWFHNYCAHVAFRFYELDSEMKAQCDELSKVGDKLRKVDNELENM